MAQNQIHPGTMTQQPLAPGAPLPAQMMPKPDAIAGVPPGLEYLTQIDQLLIHQQIDLLEAFTGWEQNNRYQLKNTMGQQVYFAAEESDACNRQCCGANRGFTLHITDNFNQEVMRVVREFKCCAGHPWCACCDCCALSVDIEAPVGTVVGTIKQKCSFCAPKFYVNGPDGETIFHIEGPTCIVQGPCCTNDVEFNVFSSDMATQVGKVSKQWSGFAREYFTNADFFGVSFPMDLDVRLKATLVGAVFLIDFMYFEGQKRNNRRGYYH